VNFQFIRRSQETLTKGYSIFGCPPTDEAFMWVKLGKSTNENFHLTSNIHDPVRIQTNICCIKNCIKTSSEVFDPLKEILM
jgi:hypothetical protein